MTLTPSSQFWPKDSKGINELYIKGKFELFNTPCVSIVGTRHPSCRAVELTRMVADELGNNGFTIVSGLALGIDGIAHMEALTKGFNTIGVIGTPLDQYYPKEHRELQDMVARQGLLVSQFAEKTKVEKYFFLKRNMTMAYICKASVIVEDRDNGGAVAQAKYCERMGKPVFVFREIYDKADITWPKELKNPILIMNASEIPKKLMAFEKQAKACEQPSLF